MTDTANFVRTLTSKVTQFMSDYEDIRQLADRISADSFLSGQAATSAQANNRKDLSAADFDNFNSAVTVVKNLLDSTNVAVNTGGSVKLAFYKLM